MGLVHEYAMSTDCVEDTLWISANYKIIRRGGISKLCMSGKFNTDEINVDIIRKCNDKESTCTGALISL